ncbi:MAG: DHHA1 domain-containing protein, partial [Candidatus Bathyarchaeia archaeon]
IIVMAGEEALRLGVDAGELSATASAVAGGSGGGKPQLGQGGKLAREKTQNALNKIEEILKLRGGA